MLTPQAIKILRKVKRLILEEPRRLDMNWWWLEQSKTDWVKPRLGYPKCGTVGCIGGWVEALTAQPDATEALGLSDDAAYDLFYPEDLVNDAAAQAQTKAHAEATAKHIERFIREHR